ncbi:2Fe-2S iron-sulfur cluster-binding protein [Streptomyces sp. NPDC126503]|uniref:2Fe-2S iron-sulfur cluster-binding protein n=1 Tax=Streptomyces sp. NPDC126503 TaxID=3155315 RepID=UPI00331CEB07
MSGTDRNEQQYGQRPGHHHGQQEQRSEQPEQHGQQAGNPGGWQPIPQSEGYDGDATAFVQLPPEFMLDGIPLEAPGHGYVPPMITPLQPLPSYQQQMRSQTPPEPVTDPAADPSGADPWAEQQAGPFTPYGRTAPYGHAEPYGRSDAYGQAEPYGHAEPYGGQPYAPPRADDGVAYFTQAEQDERYGAEERHEPGGEPGAEDPQATAEWRFEAPPEAGVDPGVGPTGQWQFEVPTAPVSYAEAPPTLPGGAAAPWAVQEVPAGSEPPVTDEPVPAAAAESETEAGVEAEVRAEPEAPAAEGAPDVPPSAEAPLADVPAADVPLAEEPVQAATFPDSGPDEAPSADVAPVEAPADDAPVDQAPAGRAPVDEALADQVPDPGSVEAALPPPPAESDEHPNISYTLRVNGTDRPVTDSWIGESLLYVLRERLGLAGAKDGCSQGECGACNVQVDGRLVASCLVPAATAAGSEVRTVEGLAVDGEPSDVQRALARCGTVQCGFCIPGMCMTVHDLLEGNHAPTELETRQALAGNLCRCSGYRGVLEAVRDVVAEREASAAATSPETPGEPRVPQQIPHPHDGGMA